MPLNHDWPTWLQHLYMAVQEAYGCYTELGEVNTSHVPAEQQSTLDDLQVQAYQVWRSVEEYVAPKIEAWKHEGGG
jgi:starvation-inducible outer membrane lipoprotein